MPKLLHLREMVELRILDCKPYLEQWKEAII